MFLSVQPISSNPPPSWFNFKHKHHSWSMNVSPIIRFMPFLQLMLQTTPHSCNLLFPFLLGHLLILFDFYLFIYWLAFPILWTRKHLRINMSSFFIFSPYCRIITNKKNLPIWHIQIKKPLLSSLHQMGGYISSSTNGMWSQHKW